MSRWRNKQFPLPLLTMTTQRALPSVRHYIVSESVLGPFKINHLHYTYMYIERETSQPAVVCVVVPEHLVTMRIVSLTPASLPKSCRRPRAARGPASGASRLPPVASTHHTETSVHYRPQQTTKLDHSLISIRPSPLLKPNYLPQAIGAELFVGDRTLQAFQWKVNFKIRRDKRWLVLQALE